MIPASPKNDPSPVTDRDGGRVPPWARSQGRGCARLEVWIVTPSRFRPLSGLLADCLGADERRRRDAFASRLLADRFTIRRAWLRQILSCRLNVAPAALAFEAEPDGKPRLATGQADDLHFNLSHSGDCAVIAVNTGAPVGVDVEAITPGLDPARLAAATLAPDELMVWRSLPPSQRPSAFLHSWTGKEAVLKAFGWPLEPHRLPGISVLWPGCDLQAAATWRVLTVARPRTGRAVVALRTVDIGSGYLAALAIPAITTFPDITIVTAAAWPRFRTDHEARNGECITVERWRPQHDVYGGRSSGA